MKLLLIGPPGAGKGTQAVRIAQELHIPHISTGDIFRDNIRGGTELGLRVKDITESGRLVPDELTNEIVADRLARPDAEHGYLLDGYPRTKDQVLALRAFNATRSGDLDHVVELVVEDEDVVARLLKRAELEGRADDTEDVIRERLRIYHEQTEVVAQMAREQGQLRQVDGNGSVDEVFARVMAVLDRVPQPGSVG